MNQIKKRGVEFILVITLLIFVIQLTSAADVYKPYLHNPIVPEHPSLNMQGTYETDLWPGAATYNYPFDVSPGINGLQPVISLNYNSHLTNQQPSIVGTAWEITENYIQRDVAYSFSNISDDKFKLILNGQLYNLVYDSSDKRFHTEIESYLYIQNISGGNNSKEVYWVVKSKDGATYRFGYNQDSELVSNLHDYVVKWSLDLISDTHNNNIYYSYLENPYPNDFGAVYPYKIEYNNDKSRVIEFVLENSDRLDKWLTYEQGNKKRESRRIQEIQVRVNGNLVRKYLLNYTTSSSNSKSSLASITQYGGDGVTSLPSVTFEYYSSAPGWYVDNNFILPSSNGLLFEFNQSDYGVRLLDLNRDGLIDITKADGKNPQYNQSWINNGTGWVRNDSWNIPYNLVNNNQKDTGIRFIDVNGDGFTDIVVGDGTFRKSWINNGTGWVVNSSWDLPTNANPVTTGSNIFERGVRFEDINGDGLVDILSVTNSWNYTWINNGIGWIQNNNSWKIPSDAYFSDATTGKDMGVRIVDINGDGLPDLIKGNSNNTKTWLNNGTGWVQDDSWKIPSDAYFSDATTGKDNGVRIVDINGDNLPDLVQRKGGSTRKTWINNETGWMRDDSWSVPATAYFISASGTNEAVRIVDVNGDGMADLMNGENSSNRISFVNKGSMEAYLLKKITNNLGGSTIIDYIPSTTINNTGMNKISNLGFNLWIVGAILKNNGMGGLQNNSFSIYNSYLGGYYDYNSREFRGFNRVDEIKPNVSITRHWFYQNNSLKGKEYTTELFDSNSKPFAKVNYLWDVNNLNDYSIITLSSEINLLYDSSYDAPKITETKYSYDNYGNILSRSSLGDNSTQNDERYEYSEYVYNLSNWIVNKPKRYAIYNGDNTTKIRETFYRYDNLNYGDSPVMGDLTWEEQWLNTGDNPITKYSYSSNGNLINETDANGRTTQYIYGLRDLTNTFVDQIINAKGFIINFDSDLGTGNLLSEADTNGYTTSYVYDVFGRIVKEILPYDDITYPTKDYSYSLDGIAPESIKIMQRENNGINGTFDSYYFYDGFGNLLQTKTEAENSKQIVNDIYYDNLGRIIKQSNPYFTTIEFNYSNPDLSVSTMDYSYDPLSRIIKIKNQDNTTQDITFDHRKIIFYDENGNKKIYFTDVYDQIIKVIEYLTNNYFTTKYAYDSTGAITQINDSYENIINYAYDSLGRKVQESNMDSGTWKYHYDPVGNLINQIDNNSINVSLQYDELNRVIKKSIIGEEINYTYDQINGTLWKTETPSLTTSYTYDHRLRNTEEIRIIDGKNLVRQMDYNAMDKIKTETLPDNSIISYNYTVHGQIKQLTSILSNVDYNALNQPTKLSYQNNLYTNYTYNTDTFRVEKIKTSNKQELNYEYDHVGNVVSINDTSNNFFISLTYDNLNRLIHSKKEGSNNFEFDYTYDFLGNILKIIGDQKNMTYFYNLNPKHAPYLITKTEILIPLDLFKFYIRNSTGNSVAWLGNLGNIVLKGNCFSGGSCDSPGENSFIVGNLTDSHTAFINSTGDLCIEKGDCSDESVTCNPIRNAFIIRNSSNANVSYIDFDGDLCLTGKLYENSIYV